MASPARKPAPHGGPIGREDAVVDRIGDLLSAADSGPRAGEIHLGDDAAVLDPLPEGHQLVLCSDVAVAGIHADLGLLSLSDLGWRAAAACLSDLAAMGAHPVGMVASVVLSAGVEVEELLGGVIEAASAFGCPLVGGDLSAGPAVVIDVAATGSLPTGTAMRRDGGRAGDTILLTGALGASAAGLRALRSGEEAEAAIEAHRRPVPRLSEGLVAREAGVRCAMDVSDGLGLDLARLARASGVGVELDAVPVAESATEAEALGGGEDYELLLVTDDPTRLEQAFVAEGLTAPIRIGRMVADPSVFSLRGAPMEASGYRHEVGEG